MKLNEYDFSEYYHQFVTIEADVLTERFRDTVEVREDDCFALCSCYVNEEGMSCFPVLSIGPTWETCVKGLELPDMLGVLTIEDVEESEARLVEADMDMVEKNDAFLENVENDGDATLFDLRLNGYLDPVRDVWYPDVVSAELPSWEDREEYAVRLTGMNGIFLRGIVEERLDGSTMIPEGEIVWMFPSLMEDEPSLLIVCSGEDIDETILEQLEKFMEELLSIEEPAGLPS